MTSKIRSEHLQRPAFVYLRQSSPGQVEFHKESTERQYALADRAVTLGWDRSQIRILDGDLGKSGTSTEGRNDFLALMAAVGMGEAGAVFAIEISRFSRSQADWHKLLDICALTDTLVVDHDGVYNPNDFNDRVLLGFKGTWSHTELHGMKLRLQGARVNKAKKGELRCRPPAGYVYDLDGKLELDPDESVVAALGLVFQKFRELGGGLAVTRYFTENKITLPNREWIADARGGRLSWTQPSHCRILSILKNPTYAGVYVYGRTRGKKRFIDGQISEEKELVHDESQWISNIKNAHPGYITWEQFLENREQLARNRFNADFGGRRGVARKGSALLQGIVICGKCGNRMHPHYYGNPKQPPTYVCAHKRAMFGESTCWVVSTPRIDRALTTHLLELFSREKLDLSLAVLTEVEKATAEDDKQWQLRLERARIAVERAERQYDRVEPENRLVARTLEQKWNEALAEQERLNQEYALEQKKKPLELSSEQRQQIMGLTKDFSKIWNSATTTDRDRKELLGLLVKQVALSPIDLPERQTKIDVLWHTGATTVAYAPRPRNARATKTPAPVIEEIRKLADRHHDREIAEKLNKGGFRSGMRRRFTETAVTYIRHRYGIEKPGSDPAFAAKGELLEGRYLSRTGLAKRLRVSNQVIVYWQSIGALPAFRMAPRGPWWYELTDEVLARLKPRISKNHRNPRSAKIRSLFNNLRRGDTHNE